jgi:hypothetical protein
MKPGKIIRTFSAKDGRGIVLRTPTWSDLDDLMEIINSLIEEGADILIDEKVSRDQEIDWLSKALARLKKDEALYLVAVVNGKVVGTLSSPERPGAMTDTRIARDRDQKRLQRLGNRDRDDESPSRAGSRYELEAIDIERLCNQSACASSLSERRICRGWSDS